MSYVKMSGNLATFSSAYIDDSWLMGIDRDTCAKNVIDTIQLMEKLGFVVHPQRSVLICTYASTAYS